MRTAEAVDRYYNRDQGLQLYDYQARGSSIGNIITRNLTCPLKHNEDLDSDQIAEAMLEASQNLQLISYGGSYFEISILNGGLPNDNIDLHVSTYSSSLSTNPGNVYEFAARAVRYPNRKQLYVASFAMGSTSPLLKEDAAFAGISGRFTSGLPHQAKPLTSIHNLHMALLNQGWAATKIMGTDSAGGHVARALGVAMEPGQLEAAFFSEPSGFKDMSAGKLALRMLVKEGQINARRNNKLSPDPEKMTKEKISLAKDALAAYASSDKRLELAANKVKTKDTISGMLTSLAALKRGPIKGADPNVAETSALLYRQPQAKITFGLAEHDPLYVNSKNCHDAAAKFLSKVALQDEPLRVLVIPGMTHAYNTFFPSLYHAITRELLYTETNISS